MAPLLHASLHGLRCSRLVPSPFLSSQRELLRPPRELQMPPESSCILRRWYGESAALEETCSSTQTVSETALEETYSSTQTVSETAGAVVQGEDSSKTVVENSLKEIPTSAVKEEFAFKETASALNTDKLSSLIMGKLRSKNNLNAPKDEGVPLQAESTPSEAIKLPVGSSQRIADDKWKQVMMSMRNLNLKRRANMASGVDVPTLAKSGEGDDFSDLDLPQAQDEAVSSKVSSKSGNFSRPAMDALRNYVKPKENEFQGLNDKQRTNGFQGYQQKPKETKPTSFSFVKSPYAISSTSGVTDKKSGFSSLEDPLSKFRSSFKKDPQSIKSSNLLNESFREGKNAHSQEVKSVSAHEAKRFPSHETVFVEDLHKERASSNAREATSAINRTIYPGYTVCIRNLPSQSNLGLVKEALSLHGEVISSFKKSHAVGSCTAFIEFKTAEAMDDALTARWLTLDGNAFSIVSADAPVTTVVRLSAVSGETTDSQLISMCEQFGSIDLVRRRGNGVHDVYYKANELPNMSRILDSLNEVMLNQRRLVALPAPLLHLAMSKEVLKRSEGQAWHAAQLSQTLNRIETGLEAVCVCFEDLKSLTAMEDDFTKLP